MEVIAIIIALFTVPVLVLVRLIYLIFILFTSDCYKLGKTTSLRTILCVGSGGHTSELLRLLKSLDPEKYQPRLYIAADNDLSSEVKIHTLEGDLGSKTCSFNKIPRSRNVNQSYSSSVLSTLHATLYTIPLVYKFQPDLILCNGPGTCVPICIVAFLLRCCFLLDCRIIFVESICRVRTLSLSGKILQYFADIIVVQWPQLRDICWRAKYFGRLT